MSDEPQKEPRPGGENPPPGLDLVDLKKNVGGIGLLILVCGILWILSSFGPKGATWISNQTTKVLGVNQKTPPVDSKTTPAPPTPESPPAPKEPSVTSKIEIARAQILEELGGPEKAVVKYVAISKDQTSLVAAVIFHDAPPPQKLVEIYFEQDDYERYVSKPDSPVPHVIKIWIQQ